MLPARSVRVAPATSHVRTIVRSAQERPPRAWRRVLGCAAPGCRALEASVCRDTTGRHRATRPGKRFTKLVVNDLIRDTFPSLRSTGRKSRPGGPKRARLVGTYPRHLESPDTRGRIERVWSGLARAAHPTPSPNSPRVILRSNNRARRRANPTPAFKPFGRHQDSSLRPVVAASVGVNAPRMNAMASLIAQRESVAILDGSIGP